MSLQGAGSILGGLTAAMLMRRVGPGRAVGLGLAMIALASIAPAASLLPALVSTELLLALVLPSLFLAGVGVPWIFVSLVTTRQRLTPARLQGRAAAATNLVLNVPQLVSIAAGALLVGMMDYRGLMLGAAVVISACALSMLLGEREPHQKTPAPAPDLTQRN
ncbi:MFS transporter [Paeniglutamicibacter gangotriensis]|uniref:MFS transporter n=1 Tax=Paeniglutamicibacter gangotriensis TaxID=254787 RepID=A0A5B0E353_9MICC|nr:MFS transporter [Paeniglutamicibacter gangotriensis]KAA0972772.1 MFS transporter [Paeniglutamicibacter gangotriensis]